MDFTWWPTRFASPIPAQWSSSSQAFTFGYARMFAEHGCASLLLEMRSHGESKRGFVVLGFREHRDVRAAVDCLRAQPRCANVPIVIFGLFVGWRSGDQLHGAHPRDQWPEQPIRSIRI